MEYEAVRDFVIAHYALSAGREEPFWRHVRAAVPPDSLLARIEAFRETGTILYDGGDLFGPTNWYAVFTGQGVLPRDHHPIAAAMPADTLATRIAALEERSRAMVAQLPPHPQFIARTCAAG